MKKMLISSLVILTILAQAPCSTFLLIDVGRGNISCFGNGTNCIQSPSPILNWTTIDYFPNVTITDQQFSLEITSLNQASVGKILTSSLLFSNKSTIILPLENYGFSSDSYLGPMGSWVGYSSTTGKLKFILKKKTNNETNTFGVKILLGHSGFLLRNTNGNCTDSCSTNQIVMQERNFTLFGRNQTSTTIICQLSNITNSSIVNATKFDWNLALNGLVLLYFLM